MRKVVVHIVLLLFCACREETFYDGDFFFLTNKQAQMPVSVRGNVKSGLFILFLHGGPGGTALQKIGLPAFNKLESSYATVFWDQRSSGSSQGNSPKNLLTLEQFTEDLDKLVDLLRHKYDNPKIFLLGHSWGGCLGTSYLIDRVRQDKIRGWIEVDGAHNNPMGDDLSLQWVSKYARQQITANSETAFWNYVLDWYKKNPNFTSDQLEHYSFVEKAHGYIFDPTFERDPKKYPAYSFDYLFHSPADVTAALTNYNNVIKNFIISDIDLTAAMKNITLPTLIVWGENDGVIPYPMARQAYDALGTSVEQKSILTLPNTAHDGYYEEPELFAEGVIGFIEKYK